MRNPPLEKFICRCQILYNPLPAHSSSVHSESACEIITIHDGSRLKIKNGLKIHNIVTAWTVRQHSLVLKFLINEIFFLTTCKIFTRNPYGTTATLSV